MVFSYAYIYFLTPFVLITYFFKLFSLIIKLEKHIEVNFFFHLETFNFSFARLTYMLNVFNYTLMAYAFFFFRHDLRTLDSLTFLFSHNSVIFQFFRFLKVNFINKNMLHKYWIPYLPSIHL